VTSLTALDLAEGPPQTQARCSETCASERQTLEDEITMWKDRCGRPQRHGRDCGNGSDPLIPNARVQLAHSQ